METKPSESLPGVPEIAQNSNNINRILNIEDNKAQTATVLIRHPKDIALRVIISNAATQQIGKNVSLLYRFLEVSCKMDVKYATFQSEIQNYWRGYSCLSQYTATSFE